MVEISGKSIIMQVILIFETIKVIKFILTCLLLYHKFRPSTKLQAVFNLDYFILNFNATQINVQGGIFLKINKCADQNKAVQGGIMWTPLNYTLCCKPTTALLHSRANFSNLRAHILSLIVSTTKTI